MRSFILVVLTAVILSDLSIKETKADVRLYRRYRLNKDKRGAASDYSTSSYAQATPTQSQSTSSSSSQANYALSPGIQSFAGLGGFGSSLGHGLQFTDSSPAAASHGANLGYGLNLGHGYNLGTLSLGDQGNLIMPTQTKTGPVTFNGQLAGTAGASNSYPSSALYGGIQGMATIGGQSGSYNIPLILAASPASNYAFPASSAMSGAHGLSLANLGSGGSQSYSHSVSGSQQPVTGGILIATSPMSSSKYSLPSSTSSQGAIIYAPISSAYGSSNEIDGGSSSTNYVQPIPSYGGSNTGTSSLTKYVPASSEGSAYAASESSNSISNSNYRIPNSAYSSPSSSYSSPSSSYSSSSPNYASSSSSYSSPNAYSPISSSYSSPSSNYVSPVASYSSSSSQNQASPSYATGNYHSPNYSGSTKGGTGISYANSGASYASPSVSYSSPSSSYSHPSSSQSVSGHNFAGTNYGSPSVSYSGGNLNHLTQSASYSNPSVSYVSADSGHSGSSGYTTSYSNPTSSHSSQGDLSGAYAGLTTKYLRYPTTKVAEKKQSDLSEYDTISYSGPTGLS
ncbi:DNA-directed RNA polymerase II subunit RPB1-like [Leptopilina boulardi]|uniref:DNA-directed RNA polymerase II subunit RPB1-like n=1 Tax=Leptopilina boulardi TaxID=63433 RepID=UPI0021F5F2E5|nr:DNA-directed RNA polymerase II subunit RPB1-like [Leptopilina boulardi]